MSAHRSTSIGLDPDRHLIHALAALREATECLEDAAAAGRYPSASVGTAIAHVVAARSLLQPAVFGAAPDHVDPGRNAA